ncbi:MAG TPA: VF530 family protein [Planctomycetota bacterium]|nr:VF530 family protein [Planctomycetota bacterium]
MRNEQPNNPLHGVTLAAMLEFLVDRIGWQAMARAVDIRCFTHEPSLTSSLKFLRKVPWARAKVEQLYVHMARQAKS